MQSNRQSVTTAFLSLALASLPGCDTRASEQEKASRPSEPERTVLPGGNPTLGQVTFLMQIHSVGGESDRALKFIGEYQGAILHELVRNQPRAIFQEGRSTALTSHEIDREIDVKWLREVFPDGVPSNFNQVQLRTLGAYGAASVYAALQPGVSLLPTADPQFEGEIHQAIESMPAGVVRNYLCMDLRERECAETMAEYAAYIAGGHVCVIYGANHKNLPYQVTGPLVEVVRFPDQIKAFREIDEIGKQTDAVAQRKLVEQAPYIPSYDFDKLLTEEIRDLALDKLDAWHEWYPQGPGDFRDQLLQACETTVLRDRVHKHFEALTGPFVNFNIFEISSRISSAPLNRQTVMVRAAPAIQAWAFPWLGEEAQLEAVWKLVPNGGEPSEKLNFNELLEGARSSKVRAKLEERM